MEMWGLIAAGILVAAMIASIIALWKELTEVQNFYRGTYHLMNEEIDRLGTRVRNLEIDAANHVNTSLAVR